MTANRMLPLMARIIYSSSLVERLPVDVDAEPIPPWANVAIVVNGLPARRDPQTWRICACGVMWSGDVLACWACDGHGTVTPMGPQMRDAS
jgi:hypothetical protein